MINDSFNFKDYPWRSVCRALNYKIIPHGAGVKNEEREIVFEDQVSCDIASYIDSLKSSIKALSADQYVTIIETGDVLEVNETNTVLKPTYKIVVSGVIFNEDSKDFNDHSLILEKLADSISVDGFHKSSYLYVEFVDCKFTTKNEFKARVFVLVGYNVALMFKRCRFEGVDLQLGPASLDVSVLSNLISIADCVFLGCGISLHIDASLKSIHDGCSLENDWAKKVRSAKKFEIDLNYTHNEEIFKMVRDEAAGDGKLPYVKVLLKSMQRMAVDPKYMVALEENYVLRINECKMESFSMCGAGKVFFRGRNHIKKISTNSVPSNVYWGQNQKVDTEGKNPHYNKKFFLMLRENAIEKSDKRQVLILDREVRICDYYITKEEPFLVSFEDRFIYQFTSIISNHGISWFRPIVLLLSFNVLLAYIVLISIGYDYEVINILDLSVRLLNPIANVSTYMVDDSGFLSPLLNVLHKAVMGLTAYDLIKTFRRFTSL